MEDPSVCCVCLKWKEVQIMRMGFGAQFWGKIWQSFSAFEQQFCRLYKERLEGQSFRRPPAALQDVLFRDM